MGKLILLLFLFSLNTNALPFSEYEKVELYCHFYPENKPSVNLGRMTGISNCQSSAYYYAKRNNIENTDWGYIGCTIRKPIVLGGVTIRDGSDCYERIR